MMIRNQLMCARKVISTVAVAMTLAGGAGAASADVWHFTAHLDGDQVTPPTTSSAWGDATLEYDDETNLLSADIYIEGIGLDNDWTAAHIHIGRKGFAGPWNIQLGPIEEWSQDGNGIRRILVDEPYPEEDEHNLLEDGTFIMVHTVEWPGGEIRGQVIQQPRLSISAIGRGRPAFFQVMNANAGERVYYIYSTSGTGLGQGPSIPALGGLSVDILDEIHLLASARADDSGTAVVRQTIPDNTPLIDLYFQAAIPRGNGGENSVISNTVSTVVLP